MKKSIYLFVTILVLSSCWSSVNENNNFANDTSNEIIEDIITDNSLSWSNISSENIVKTVKSDKVLRTEEVMESDDLIELVKAKYTNDFDLKQFAFNSIEEGNKVEVIEWINACINNYNNDIITFFENFYLEIDFKGLAFIKKEFEKWNRSICLPNLKGYLYDINNCDDKYQLEALNTAFSYYFWLLSDEEYLKEIDWFIEIEKKYIRDSSFDITEGLYLFNFIKLNILKKISKKEDCYKLYNDLLVK